MTTMIPASIQAASGAIGSSFANLTLFPLDVATVRAQVERESQSINYEGVGTLIVRILQDEGWRSFFEGAGDDLVATALQSFLYFFVYNSLRNKQLTRGGKKRRMLSVQSELFYGAIAGVICKLFTTPLKNIVLLKQLNATPKSFGECVKEIHAAKGVTGFWSGYRATFFLSINPSLAYYFYQLMGSKHRQTTARVFIRAAASKSLALIMTYPVILAKTRTQASESKNRSMLAELVTILRTNGFTGLYDGIEGQLLKGVFTQGITMTTKESIEGAVVKLLMNARLRA